jgi:CheY-like chemotaxis protein
MSATRILVVDDDRSIGLLVGKLLTDRGYAVDIARDGTEALFMLGQFPYKLAIIDYLMPRMNGPELLEKAKTVCPGLHGVFLTAYANIQTVFHAIDAGAERVLSKPADARELITVVEQLVGPGNTPGPHG